MSMCVQLFFLKGCFFFLYQQILFREGVHISYTLIYIDTLHFAKNSRVKPVNKGQSWRDLYVASFMIT